MLHFLERHGLLVPVLRYREPQPILTRRYVEDHPELADPALAIEPDGPRIQALAELDRARSSWGTRWDDASAPHPFDAPPPGTEIFLESPTEVPADEDTYKAIPVGRLRDGRALLEYNGCVPLYRKWQALQLLEILDETGLILYLPEPGAAEAVLKLLWGREVERVPASWNTQRLRGVYALAGFREHRAALEAVAWFQAYANRVLLLAESEDQPDGTSTISGEAFERLRREEGRLAGEALARHSVRQEDIASMVRWAGKLALKYRDRGRPKAEEGYKEVVLHALDLLDASGLDYRASAGLIGHAPPVLDRLFPDWIAEQRRRAMVTMEHTILPALATALPPLLDTPDANRADAFLKWIEAQGLNQLFWHFDELASMSNRHDRLGLAAIAREVAGMAATVEHICNALGAGPGTLYPKLGGLWRNTGTVAAVMDQNKSLAKSTGATLAQTSQNFSANLAGIRGLPTATPDSRVARDLLTAVLVRNHSTHNGLPDMHRWELIDLFVGLLRVAFLTWHVVAP